jgi:hypothetical protein
MKSALADARSALKAAYRERKSINAACLAAKNPDALEAAGARLLANDRRVAVAQTRVDRLSSSSSSSAGGIQAGWRWAIRVVVTLAAVVLELGMGSTKTLDIGSMFVAMLLVLAGTVAVWVMTKKRT